MKFWLSIRDSLSFRRYIANQGAKRLEGVFKSKPSIEKAVAYADYADELSRMGRHAVACRFAKRALEASVSFRKFRVEALAHLSFSVALLSACRFDEAREQANIALAMFENGGDPESALVARCRVVECALWLGHAAHATAEASDLYRAACDIEARGIAARAISLWAMASSGAVPDEVLETEIERSTDGFAVDRCRLWRAKGISLLKRSDFTGASAAFEESLCSTSRLAHFPAEVLASRLWLVTSQRMLFEEKKNLADRELQKRWNVAMRTAECSLRPANRFRQHRPHLLREVALLAALREQERRARRAIDSSMASANELSLFREYALSLEARGRIGVRFDWPQCDDDLDDGRYFAGKLQTVQTLPRDYERSVDQLRGWRIRDAAFPFSFRHRWE